MSSGIDALKLNDVDAAKMLAAGVHLGSPACDFQMKQYKYSVKKTPTGNVINLRQSWEKLLLAARAIVAIENPADVCVLSSKSYGQRAVLKYAAYTGATSIAGRYTPGAFTNQIQAAFREPRLLVVTDPHSDTQPLTEASYVNIPVIAFANLDSPLRYVDIAIPCNNKTAHAIGLMWWFLAREVLCLRGQIPHKDSWEVKVDLFFYREPEEIEKEEQARQELQAQAVKPIGDVPAPPQDEWTTGPPLAADDWSADISTQGMMGTGDGFGSAFSAQNIAPGKINWVEEVEGAGQTTDWTADTAGNWA